MALTYAQQKALAMQWKAAAPALRKQRHRDIRRQDNVKAIEALSDISDHVLRTSPPRKSSGLVRMYEYLGRSLER